MAEPPAEPQEFETHEEILAWARRHYGRRWLRSLTAEEFEALQALKSDAHAAINAQLRNGRASVLPSIATIRRWTTAANGAIARSPLPESLIAQRGIDLSAVFGDVDLGLLAGDSFEDPGFVAATLWSPAAHRFGRDLLRLEVPTGTPAAWSGGARTDREFELLLHSGTWFSINRYQRMTGTRILNVTLLERPR